MRYLIELCLGRFEAGTPAIAEAIGLGAAIDYLSSIGMEKIHNYEVQFQLASSFRIFLVLLEISLFMLSIAFFLTRYICRLVACYVST